MKWILLAVCTCLSAGCFTNSERAQRVQYVIRNETGQPLESVVARINSKYTDNQGILGNAVHKSFSGDLLIRPQNDFRFSWQAESVTHEATLTVSKQDLTDRRVRVFVISPDMSIREEWRY